MPHTGVEMHSQTSWNHEPQEVMRCNVVLRVSVCRSDKIEDRRIVCQEGLRSTRVVVDFVEEEYSVGFWDSEELGLRSGR